MNRGVQGAVLITGVYGSGKSSVAQQIADLLEKRNAPYALLDLDFLGWFDTGEEGRSTEHSVMLKNLAALIGNYLAIGVGFFVLAGGIRDRAQLDDLKAEFPMPLRVVRLTVPLPEIARPGPMLQGRHRGAQLPVGITRKLGQYPKAADLSRLLLGSLFRPIAADVAVVAPDGARVLEAGCGPGHLSIQLARQHGLDVTGLDLDPAMIERARANADRAGEGDERRPSFLVGDVASLPFPDGSFDLVVSTMSMHHWADPTAGLAEINRVLHPGARALIWDFRPGVRPFHGDLPDLLEHTHGSPLRVVSATPWHWPWRFKLTQRIELLRADGSPAH